MKNLLTEKEVTKLLSLYLQKLYYTSQLLHIADEPFDKFYDRGKQHFSEVREKGIYEPELIDDLLGKNPFKWKPKERQLILAWSRRIPREYTVLDFCEGGALLYEEERDIVYLVQGISDPLKTVWKKGHRVYTLLLPFNGKIVTDGLWQTGKKSKVPKPSKYAKENIVTTIPTA
jgi:hypothetical protein